MNGSTQTLMVINIILVILVALLWHRCNEILMDSNRWINCQSDEYSVEDPDRSTTEFIQGGSSVWCKGNNNTDRTCHFHNLCFSPVSNSFVFLHGDDTIIDSVPHDRFSPALLDLSSVSNHNTQYFHYDDVPVDGLLYQFKYVVMHKGPHFMFNRFNPSNLMHVVHDDLLPVFYTLLQFGFLTPETLKSSARLVFLEGWHEGEFFDMYQWMSRGRALLLRDLTQEDEYTLVCFEDAYFGMSKVTTWYQYGFDQPQGRTPNAKVTAREVRIFTRAFMQFLNSSNRNVAIDKPQACLFVRNDNRLILNQAEVTSAIAQRTGLTTVKMSLDDVLTFSDSYSSYRTDTFRTRLAQFLQSIQRCQVVVGMHGSLLVLSMFLHPGSIVLEMFPYAVNPDHYTPYKTLANLPNMGITYKSWRNTILEHTVSHPEGSPEQGGIVHLSKKEQLRIMDSKEVSPHLCCSNPEWLFRIYQDTIVDIPSFLETMSAALDDRETSQCDKNQLSDFEKVVPGVVRNVTCERAYTPGNIYGIRVSWIPPWNLQFFKTIDNKYEVWIQELGKEDYKAWMLEMTEYVFTDTIDPDKDYNVWVRCLIGNKVGSFAPVILC